MTADQISFLGLIVAAVALFVAIANFGYFFADFQKRFKYRFQVIVVNATDERGKIRCTGHLRNRGFPADVFCVEIVRRLPGDKPNSVWVGARLSNPICEVLDDISFNLELIEDKMDYAFIIHFNSSKSVCLMSYSRDNVYIASDVS